MAWPEPVRLDLPSDTTSAGRARDWLAEVFRGWGVVALTPDALVVVSELVTNAVVHGRTACTVELISQGPGVRIAVTDHGTGQPDLRPLSPTAANGRGLFVVRALSEAWGVEAVTGGGKTVWAELVYLPT